MKFHIIIPADKLSKIHNGLLKWDVTKVMTSHLVSSNMDVRHQERVAIEYLRLEGIKHVGIVDTRQKVHRDEALSQLTTFHRLGIFKYM